MTRDLEMLVTVRRPELLDAATLTLQTVRTGFPDGRLVVFGNDLDAETAAIVERRASQAGGEFHNLTRQRHDLWLLWRLESSTADELVILDGDMVFHRDMARLKWNDAGNVLIGPHEPQHRNPLTGAIHQPRIHTCFWWCRPTALRRRLADYRASLPRVPWPMPWHPTAQAWIPGDPPTFHDTGAQLCRVVGASAFDARELTAFTHLHCGTWSDLAREKLPDVQAIHAAAIAGRLTETDFAGIRQAQADWYARHAT